MPVGNFVYKLDGGLNSWGHPGDIEDNQLADVLNVAFGRKGAVATRSGSGTRRRVCRQR